VSSADLGRARNAGFTLAEMLAVLVIAAIILGLLIGVVGHVRRGAFETRAHADIERIRAGVEECVLRTGVLPGSLADIPWGPDSRLSLSNGCPVDPWGAQYVYSNNGARAYEVYSMGENTTNVFDDIRAGID
jgi:prepilin-type N-terminal cleavage/methylation domain-containing protein